MSKPSPGSYFIINRVTALGGKVLALNYDGKDAVITVTELDNSPTQVWIISDYKDGKTQSVVPQSASGLEIGWEGRVAGGFLKTVTANGNVWTIREDQGLTTIQDGGLEFFWGLQEAISGEGVSYNVGTGDEKQNWFLIPA